MKTSSAPIGEPSRRLQAGGGPTAAGLFFAGIIWFSLEITPRFWKLADEYLLSSRRDTELQILGNTVGVIRRNERTLQRADSLFAVAVLLLFLGTLLVGVRVALLLL